jgi:hypothetical protein
MQTFIAAPDSSRVDTGGTCGDASGRGRLVAGMAVDCHQRQRIPCRAHSRPWPTYGAWIPGWNRSSPRSDSGSQSDRGPAGVCCAAGLPASSQPRGSGVRAAMLCSSRFSFHSRGCGTANPCSERSRPMTHGLTLDDSARLAGRTATRVIPAYRAAETLVRDDSRSSIPDIVRAVGGFARRVHSSEAHPTLPLIHR